MFQKDTDMPHSRANVRIEFVESSARRMRTAGKSAIPSRALNAEHGLDARFLPEKWVAGFRDWRSIFCVAVESAIK
ncbi:MAG: hypothetical protein P4L40_25425 [Terracidiphilus sp.]|nr:hypothetical protein [Terracidiphilus sp.]